jgi:hypothetical protein
MNPATTIANGLELLLIEWLNAVIFAWPHKARCSAATRAALPGEACR